ncbi:17640_t:CDS:2 [Gigaspora margarita]|uniref:17640_t:CDS:1 n=1 Tax=Gigaspora margarita TaxID=4874 RepID=A0ABM8VXE6_GIGMA|nr:17640_t:CDS:2 [Gigaspora margarita]
MDPKKIKEKKKQIYQKILTSNQKNPSFILHSGPTYANGKIHLGHVLNSIIKDIIVRFQANAHGLPVEHKVLQIYPQQKTDLRQTCYQFACEQAQLQKEQLKKLGLFTDYGKSYITLNKEYEAEQIRIFGDLPWTIPANQLIAVKKNASYALVNFSNEYLIILEKKISLLEKLKKEGVKVEKVFPVVDGEEFVQEKEGTGLVHLAPAFGAEDFILAKKEKIKISCPLEPNGCFNEKIGIPELVSKHYSAVNNYIIADLEKKNLVVKKEEITHNYPHDWRDKSPLIYRLTEQ